MEFSNRRPSFVCLLLLFVISILFTFTCVKAEDVIEPRRNDNLTPFQQWRSAVECMFNKSTDCRTQQQISLNLTIEVSQEEAFTYCNLGCLDHTLLVLDCVDSVNRDFWFVNKFGTRTFRHFLLQKCYNSSGFSYKEIQSSAMHISQKMLLAIILPFFATLYIVISNI